MPSLSSSQSLLVADIDIRIPVCRLPHAIDLPLPAYATADSAGLDLLAAIEETRILAPGNRTLVPTGLSLALPCGFEAQIRPRSGLALHHGVTVLNSPGTIDADYRGEIGVILINFGSEAFSIVRGSRIAQLVLARYHRVTWDPAMQLPPSGREKGGFGSTG